jgi:rhodanese-related sulfurtransferase
MRLTLDMEQFIVFFTQHWVLSLLLVVVILAIFIYEGWAKVAGPGQISAGQAVQVINHENGVIIDLRDSATFKQGHIINAVNLPASDLAQQTKVLEKYHQKPVILISAPSQRLALVFKFLQQHNFTKVNVLRGGMRAWQEANLPVEK